MEDFVKRMIDEHKQLKERFEKLQEAVGIAEGMSGTDDALERYGKTQLRLMIQQLAGMTIYEDALATRLLDLRVDPYDGYTEID